MNKGNKKTIHTTLDLEVTKDGHSQVLPVKTTTSGRLFSVMVGKSMEN